MQVKALACELPHQHGLPLSRYSGRDLVREVARRGLVASISGRTLWRWLDRGAVMLKVGFSTSTKVAVKLSTQWHK